MPEHSGHGILSCPHERRNYHWLAIGWLITSLDITLDTTHTSHEIHMVVVSNSIISVTSWLRKLEECDFWGKVERFMVTSCPT